MPKWDYCAVQSLKKKKRIASSSYFSTYVEIYLLFQCIFIATAGSNFLQANLVVLKYTILAFDNFPMVYSFVVPIYNDGYLAPDFAMSFEEVFKKYLETDDIAGKVELIFVNDGSSDGSLAQLILLTTTYKFIKVIDLSRNFGQHIALSCGYKNAKGDYVGMLNVDMQDHPAEIPKLLNCLTDGRYDIVYGLVERRRVPFIDRITSIAFNRVLNFLTKSKTPLNVATLRIMNRKFVNAYNQLQEKARYIPGLENWLGFRHGYVQIVHRPRAGGKSSYTFKKRLLMAVNSIISFSDYPLKLIVSFGSLVSVLGFLMTIYIVASKVFFVDYKAGFTSTISLITFFGGMQIMVIGFAALYIGRILTEVQKRPLYIINEKYNF